ncbi:MAG: site-specific integrase [Lachnospiraceae bacterium]|nr:site-specific integrase [Lachnospiraceae bacterium]
MPAGGFCSWSPKHQNEIVLFFFFVVIFCIENLIRKLCAKCGIEAKSSHDIRRTVASELNAQGVNVEMIRAYLGHSDVKTTFGYIYNNRSKEETNNLLLNSLSKMNGLTWTQD